MRRLFTGILTATVGVGACGGNGDDPVGSPTASDEDAGGDASFEVADAGDAGFCSDDRPPEMRNYPGCFPPFCVEAPFVSGAGRSDCQTLCGPTVRPVGTCKHFVHEDAEWIKCQMDCTGRRPLGFTREPSCITSLGTYFSEMARLEAASITAFRILARELAEHGAPRSLQRTARRAARDEIRHTRTTRALASRFGAKPLAPRIERTASGRSLEAIAIENAREGCVRETFGALTAMYQSRASTDPAIRRALGRIARDEVGHAGLAWRVKRWTDSRLGPEARERVRSALLEEMASLGAGLRSETAAPFRSVLGLPSGNALVELANALVGPLFGERPAQSST